MHDATLVDVPIVAQGLQASSQFLDELVIGAPRPTSCKLDVSLAKGKHDRPGENGRQLSEVGMFCLPMKIGELRIAGNETAEEVHRARELERIGLFDVEVLEGFEHFECFRRSGQLS